MSRNRDKTETTATSPQENDQNDGKTFVGELSSIRREREAFRQQVAVEHSKQKQGQSTSSMQNEIVQGRKLMEGMEEQSRLEAARLGLEARNLQQEMTIAAMHAKAQQA